jgi:hypothetical protein
MLDGQIQTCNRHDFADVEKGFFCESRPQLGEDGRSEKSPLVHITESVGTFKDVIDQKTGEIQRFRLNERTREYCPVSFSEDALFERFKLQKIAREILENAPHPRGEKSRWRTVFCLRHLRKDVNQVAVMLSREFNKAHYKNLIVCGSPWSCPCCAVKISEGRKAEIEVAADIHMAAGGFLYMLTYTFSHSIQDSLVELLGTRQGRRGLTFALKRFRDSHRYRKLCESVGFIGLIRNLEVTDSWANGWHPHIHELWFCSRQLTEVELRSFKNQLFDLWYQACLKACLSLPNRKHGVDIVRAFSPADYLQKVGREQKWGVGAELTRSHTKKSRDRKGLTPFDFLRLIAEGHEHSDYYAKRFVEYVTAFFGARQCFWSPGLKKAFGIGEMSDEQLAVQENDRAQLVSLIDKEVWKKGLKLPYDFRPVILRLAETGGKEAIERFLSSLSEKKEEPMPMLDGVEHDIPEQIVCEKCSKPIRYEYVRKFTIEGKLLVFAASCDSCDLVNLHFAGEAKYIREFNSFLKAVSTGKDDSYKPYAAVDYMTIDDEIDAILAKEEKTIDDMRAIVAAGRDPDGYYAKACKEYDDVVKQNPDLFGFEWSPGLRERFGLKPD